MRQGGDAPNGWRRAVPAAAPAATAHQVVARSTETTSARDAEDPETNRARPEQEPEQEPGLGTLGVFGRQLKRFRTRAGLDRRDFGALTGYSPSTIAAYEQGRRIPPPRFIDQVDEALDAGGVLLEMKGEVQRAQFPAFFRDAAKLEREAVELHVYATKAVPGLLQTEEYARAVCTMWRPPLKEDTLSSNG